MKRKNAKSLLSTIFIIFLAWYISRNYFQLMLIQGSSMEPTYHNMQLVILEKTSANYTTGDVIAFRCDGVSGVLVKRIAAIEGDSVLIQDNTLWINDRLSSVFPQKIFFYSGIAGEKISITANQYFVLGDNILESKDSRYVQIGLVEKSNILGKVLAKEESNPIKKKEVYD